MRVRKNRAPRGQAVHVRCLRLRMPLQRPDPIVEIIDGDEEHVRLVGCVANQRGEAKQESTEKAFHTTYPTGKWPRCQSWRSTHVLRFRCSIRFTPNAQTSWLGFKNDRLSGRNPLE